MRTINKLTKLVLSFLLVITCINFSIVQAEDGDDENYSEPTAVETISEEPASEPEQEVIPEEPPATEEIIVEEPVAEEPVVEEAASVEEKKQEEAAPEVIEEAKVEEENNTPEIEAEPATQEETVEPEVQQEAPVEPEVEKVETVEEVKVTVVVSYVDENDHPLTDPITGSYPTEYRLDENVDAFKSFDGYVFEKVIVNDDAKNTISKDDVQKNGFRITKDMTSLKLVYQKMNLESNENKEVIPEVTEEAVEEAEPESNTNETELSAFDQTAFAGKVAVHASAAEGVLPKGARLIVEQVNRKAILNAVENTVSDNNKEMDSAVALDISIVDKDGNKIQPNGIVNITFVNTGVSGDEVKIYHVEDDASAVTEIANNTDSFDASHFSIYVITGEKEVPLATYTFIANDSVVSTQIVKTGDSLITPTAPKMNGKAFVGWYLGDTKFEDFNTFLTVEETKEITINAKYEDALYVYFYNPDGTKIMRTQKVADHDEHDYSSVTYDVDATHKLVGWAAVPNGKDNIAKNIAVPTGAVSTNVYAIIEQGYWVTFDSDGGSNIDSQFVFNKISLNEETTPTKPGYTFAGWYNGSDKVENGTVVTAPMTLKAYWTASEVNYTVIHWWENADDDGYSFRESEINTGLTGTEVNAKAKSYKGFTAQPVTKKTIKGDGSTIVSVYYKRNIYKVEFFSEGGRRQYTDLTIEAKYEQDISKQWPTMDGSSSWLTKPNGNTFQANIATMPLGGAKFYGPKTGYGTETAYYYVQVLPGETGTVNVNGIQYKLDHKDASPGSYYSSTSVTVEDQYPLKGYTFNEGPSTKIGQRYNGAKFYYTRNSYKIKFINKGKEDKSVEKKYEQSISSENYTPVRPSSLPDYYEFDGWYDNELCEGEAFDFNGKKMPAQNVTLYAKWTAKKINLTYNLNNPEGDVVKGTKKVEAGTIANTVLPAVPEVNDYTFAGWYVADGNDKLTTEVFHAEDAVVRNTSVIGKWLYNGNLTVTYSPGTEGDNATVPTDTKVYAGGASVTVGANATTTSNKKFLGWQLNKKLYQPGASFEINKDLASKENVVTLTAIWGSEEASTTLAYDPGNGRGTATTVPVLNNVEVAIAAHNTLGFLAPEVAGKEYYFAGWATSLEGATAGNATYSDGQTIRVDVKGTNVLYATWVEKTEITLEAKVETRTYNGQVQTLEGFKNTTVNGYTVSGLTAKTSGKDAQVYSNTVIEGTEKVVKDGVDVTDKVVVKTVSGQLTINPRQVTLTSEKASKPYDGTALTKPHVTVTGDGFVTGEVSDIHATGSVTNVSEGDVTNTITFTKGDKFKDKNYAITKHEGKLSITANDTEVTVTIKGNTATATYDGNSHSVEGYTVENISKPTLYQENNIKFTGNAKAEGIAAGEYPMNLTSAQFSNANTNFANVKFTVTDGYLTINPKSINPEDEKTGIKVTKPNDTMYNGEEQKNKPTVTDSKTGKTLTEGKDYTLSYSKDVTNAGKVEVTITGIGNYEGTANTSYQITKRNVTLTSGTASKVYDKTPLAKDEVTVSGDGFVKEEGATYNVTGSQTEVGSSKNKFTYALKSNTKASNYNITKVEGDLIVTSQDGEVVVTITGHKDTFEYDGTEKSVNGYDVFITQGSTYTTSDFTFNGNPEAKGTAAGTYKMNLSSTQFSNKNTNFTKVRFIVTDGELTITPKSIVPDGPNTPEDKKTGIEVTKPADSKYNGEKHENKPTVTDTKTKATLEENKDYTLSYSDDVVNVGTVTVTIKGIGNYTGEFTKTYEITPREYTVTTDGAEKVYDGNPLTAGGTVNNLVDGETVNLTMTGSQTNVGTSNNTYELNWTGTAKASNYTHGKDSIGTLTVTAKPINPSDTNGIAVRKPLDSIYDGKVHRNTPFVEDKKTSATLIENTDYTLTHTGDLVNVGTVKVTVTGKGNYTGSFELSYQITKRKVTLTSASDEKVYDGNPLTNSKVTVTSKLGFAEKEGATYSVTGTITDVGTKNNTFTYTLNEGTLASNYEIETHEGTLEVTPVTDKVTVKISGNTDTVTYDGNPHSVEGYEVKEISNPLYNASSIKFTGVAKAEGTDAATYPMNLTSTQFSNSSANFTDVKFVVTDGSLTIAPKSIVPDGPDTPDEKKTGITVTKPADSKYDGEEHKNKPTVTDTKTGVTLVENKDYTLVYSDNVIDAGEVTVTIIGANNYTGRFNVTYQITQRNVTLTSASDSKVYDKKPLTKNEVIVGGDGFAKDEGATYNVTGSQTVVGSSNNEFTYRLKSNTKASNYSIEVKFGELKVTAEDGEVVVTITGHKDTFEYDGNEKSVKGYEVSITQGSTYTTDDFTFNGSDEVKETAAGTYPMGLQAEDFSNNNANYSTVTFVVNDGSLIINPKSIVPSDTNGIEVSDPSDSEYDGNPHVNPITVRDAKTNADLVENTDYTLTYSGDTTNVGTVTIIVKGIGNYTGEFTKTYRITPRPYTVTTESAEKVYDGTPLTAGGSIDGIVEGDVVEVHTTGRQINVGESKNTYELVWKGARKDNYQFKEETIGTLKVTEQSIDPGKDPDNPNPSYVGVQVNAPESQLYDGKDHQWIPEVLDKENQPLTAGKDYTVTYTDDSGEAKGDFTNVTGTIHVTISGTGNYTGSVTREYEITKRSVKLTSETDEKEFDGMPLTRPVVTIKGDGFVDGEVSDVKAIGTVTSVEESPVANKITYVTHEAFKYDNYNTELNAGTLTITPKSIIPDGPHTPDDKKTGITVENPKDVKYDGKEHAQKPIVKDEKTGVTLEEGKDYEIVYPTDIKNAGTVTATVKGIGDYNGSFEIKYNILKRDVTFTSATDSKQYDGNVFTNGSVEITGDGFVEGEGVTFNVTGSITDAGSTKNTFTYVMHAGTNAGNYNVTVVEGTLTVTAASVVPRQPETPQNPPARPSRPNVPARIVTHPATTTPAPEATVEPAKVEPTPAPTAKPEKIKEEATPQASPKGHWALINLIAAMLSVVLAVAALLAKHAKEDDEEEKDDQVVESENQDDETSASKRHRTWKIVAVIDAIAAVVVFILTENLAHDMVLVDKWTVLMVLFGLISIVSTYFARKWHEEDEDEDEQSSQNA